MSEKAMACKALSAMFHMHGQPDEVEVTFVANAVLELGLDDAEREEVMKVLKGGGDFNAFVSGIETKSIKTFFFRRLVAAALIDQKIEEDELKLINSTAKLLSFKQETVNEYIDWMKAGIEWEKKGATIVARF